MTNVVDLAECRQLRDGIELSWETMTDAIREEEGDLRSDCVSLDTIVGMIDTCNGRNNALREYIYALRDLQVAYNDNMFFNSTDRIGQAKEHMRVTLARLVACQVSLAKEYNGAEAVADAVRDAITSELTEHARPADPG